jgi:hypothetical protein
MTNEANALPTLHRCANAGINPPSVVHKPTFNFATEGANAAWRAGTPIEAWVGRVKFRFLPDRTANMIAYDLGNGEVAFSEGQQDKLLFDAPSVERLGGGVR